MTFRCCCSVSVRAPQSPRLGDRLPSRDGACTLLLRKPNTRDLTTEDSHRWSRPFRVLRRWDLGLSGLWGHSQEPSPSPTCRLGPRGHISRAPRQCRSGRAPAGLACPPTRAQGWWPWCFAAECLWGGIVEVRRSPGNTSHGARTAAYGPGRESSSSRSRWDHMASKPPRSVLTRGNQEPGTSWHWVLSGCRRMALLRVLGVFGSMVYLDLFVIVGMLAEPVVWHFYGDWGRLSLVAAADDLDTPTLEPVEKGFQRGAGHCADLVPYDHTGEAFLSHPFGRPVGLAAPAEETDRSGPGRPWPASLWPGDGSGWRWGGFWYGRALSLAWFCRCPRRRLGSSSGASTAGQRGAARCWEEGSYCCATSQAWRSRPHAPWAWRSARLCPAIGQGRPEWGSLLRVNRARTWPPHSHIRFDTFELVECRFSNIDAVSGHSDRLIWFEPL